MSLLVKKRPHSNNPKWLIITLSLVKTVNVAVHSKSQSFIENIEFAKLIQFFSFLVNFMIK